MARRRANPPPAKDAIPRRTWALIAVGLAALVLVLIVAMGGDDRDPARSCAPVTEVPDVHGLGVDPQDPDRLYVATHHGLIRTDDGTSWCRVGPIADYMGFTMHPTDGRTFWVSGHPPGGGNMGVRQSTDGGHTWRTIWDERVDFHAMTVSRPMPERLWGSFQGQTYRSDDAGDTWSTIGRTPGGTRTLEGHPLDAEIVYAAGADGIYASGDGGASWVPAYERPAHTFAVHPADADLLYASFAEGLHRSASNATDWERLPLDTDQPVSHLAISASAPDVLYAATYDAAIHKSTDGGGTWTRLR